MLGIVDKIQIKKSRPKKSYGIISGYDGESYLFKLMGNESLKIGDNVSFEGSRNEKGYYATEIQACNT